MSDNFNIWLAEQIQPRTLLLIDDSIDDCELIQKRTERFNCSWLVANDITSAKRILTGHYPPEISLIFLDLKLGTELAGVEAFRYLKQSYPTVPIVVLSGLLTTDGIASITEIGFAIFCKKPACFDGPFFTELFAVLNIPVRPTTTL